MAGYEIHYTRPIRLTEVGIGNNDRLFIVGKAVGNEKEFLLIVEIITHLAGKLYVAQLVDDKIYPFKEPTMEEFKEVVRSLDKWGDWQTAIAYTLSNHLNLSEFELDAFRVLF